MKKYLLTANFGKSTLDVIGTVEIWDDIGKLISEGFYEIEPSLMRTPDGWVLREFSLIPRHERHPFHFLQPYSPLKEVKKTRKRKVKP